MTARCLTPQVERRAAFSEAVMRSNDIDGLVARQAEAYRRARNFGVGNVNFEWDLLCIALNEAARRERSAGKRAA